MSEGYHAASPAQKFGGGGVMSEGYHAASPAQKFFMGGGDAGFPGGVSGGYY